MKKELLIVVALVLLATGILFALNLTSGKPNMHKNGFNRNFSTTAIEEARRIHFDAPMYKVCGVSNDSIFFTGKLPGKIYLATQQFKEVDTFNLHLVNIPGLWTEFQTYVEYPQAYILGGNAKCIISANLRTGQHTIDTLATNGPFGNTVRVGPETYIMRRINHFTLNADFIKLNSVIKVITSEKGLSIPLADAGFTYDGMLNYDQSTKRLIFVPFYNNNIICFDSSFQVLYKSHTIDTNQTAKSQIVNKGSQSVTFKEPPVMLNSYSWVYNGSLFVLSKLQADNEKETVFDEHLPIDEYDIRTGKYLQSYQLPVVHGQKLVSVYMTGNTAFLGLYEKDIIQYRFQRNN